MIKLQRKGPWILSADDYAILELSDKPDTMLEQFEAEGRAQRLEPPMRDLLTEVNYAIMRAFFSRPIEEQNFNASPADNEDLARAAIEAVVKHPSFAELKDADRLLSFPPAT